MSRKYSCMTSTFSVLKITFIHSLCVCLCMCLVCTCVHACRYMGLCVCRMAENFWELVLSLHYMVLGDLTIVIWIGCELISSWDILLVLNPLPPFRPSFSPSVPSILTSFIPFPSTVLLLFTVFWLFSFCVCLFVFLSQVLIFPRLT